MKKLNFKGEVTHVEYYEKDGEQRKKYTKVGALFEREDGSQCIKMFDTWFNVYPPKIKEEHFNDVKNSLKAQAPLDEDQVPW